MDYDIDSRDRPADGWGQQDYGDDSAWGPNNSTGGWDGTYEEILETLGEAADELLDMADLVVDLPDDMPFRDGEDSPLGMEVLEEGLEGFSAGVRGLFGLDDWNDDDSNEPIVMPDGYASGGVMTRAQLRERSELTSTVRDAVMVTRNTFGAAIDACARYNGTSAGDMKLGASRFKELFQNEVAINWNEAPAEGVRSMFSTGQDVTYQSVEGDTLEFVRGLFAQIEESELPVVLAALYHAWTPASRTTVSKRKPKRRTYKRRRK